MAARRSDGIASWVAFYNLQRPHQALRNRTPMAVWRAGVTGELAGAVDMTLRLDNAAFATKAIQHDANLLFRRELAASCPPDILLTFSAGAFSGPVFCLIFAPDGADDPEILRSCNP